MLYWHIGAERFARLPDCKAGPEVWGGASGRVWGDQGSGRGRCCPSERGSWLARRSHQAAPAFLEVSAWGQQRAKQKRLEQRPGLRHPETDSDVLRVPLSPVGCWVNPRPPGP